MSRRCVLGCSLSETLFPFPKIPWLRSRWLEFLHFEEGGISDRSRLCSKHFTRECFKNWTQHEMGFVKYLALTDTAVPSVYTVGASKNIKPLTRDVTCQCDAPFLKNVSIQTVPQKPKRRSQGTQVLPWEHTVGISWCHNLGTGLEASCVSSAPVKRPRVEETTSNDSSSTCTSQELSDDMFVNSASIKHSGTVENLHLTVAVAFRGVSYIQIHKTMWRLLKRWSRVLTYTNSSLN